LATETFQGHPEGAAKPASVQNEHESRGFARSIFQVDEGHRSPQTAYKYKIDFERFLDFVKIPDRQVLLDLGKEAIQELVIKYTKSLRDDPVKKYARGTVNARISAILYFLDNNDIELNRRKIRRYYPPDESTNDDRPYTVAEVQDLLSVCDLRQRAVILLMHSSGVRIGALHSMRIGDLNEIKFSTVYMFGGQWENQHLYAEQ
jgi:integrase